METNKKVLTGALLAVLLVMVGCVGLSVKLWLKEPVFFKNYLELSGWKYYSKEDESNWQTHDFQFQYVTSYDDDRYLESLKFLTEDNAAAEMMVEVHDLERPYGSEFSFFDTSGPQGNQHVYGLYAVKTLTATVTSRAEAVEPIYLSQAQVQFSDGSRQIVDLGEIVLYPHWRAGVLTSQFSSGSMVNGDGSAMVYGSVTEVPAEDVVMESSEPESTEVKPRRPITSQSSGSSSDGTTSETLVTDINITIDEIASLAFPDYDEVLEVWIDEVPAAEAAGLELDHRFPFRVECKQYRRKGYGQYDQYHIRPVIFYHDVEGNHFQYEIDNSSQYLRYWNEFSFWGLVQHLRAEGVI